MADCKLDLTLKLSQDKQKAIKQTFRITLTGVRIQELEYNKRSCHLTGLSSRATE